MDAIRLGQFREMLNYDKLGQKQSGELQQWVVDRLLRDGSFEALRLLAETIINGRTLSVRQAALKEISRVEFSQGMISQICRMWATSGNNDLAVLLVQSDLYASKPLEVSLLDAFKNVGLHSSVHWELIIKLLLQTLECKESEITLQTQTILRRLDQVEAHKAICKAAIKTANPILLKIAKSTRYSLPDTRERALFLFLTRQWKKYNNLDFDQQLLRTSYNTLAEDVRRRVVEIVRETARIEFIDIIAGWRQKQSQSELSNVDWNLTVEILTRGKYWVKLWDLAQIAPPHYGALILRRLAKEGWQPEDLDDQTTFNKLTRLAPSYVGGGVPRDYSDSFALKAIRTTEILMRPIEQNNVEDFLWLQQSQKDCELDWNRKDWLRFVEALLQWKWQHEIEITDAPKQAIIAEDFDIELEG